MVMVHQRIQAHKLPALIIHEKSKISSVAIFIAKYIIRYLHFIIIGSIHPFYHIIFIFIVITAIYLKVFPCYKGNFFGRDNTAFYYFFPALIYFIYIILICYLLQPALFCLDIAYMGDIKRI